MSSDHFADIPASRKSRTINQGYIVYSYAAKHSHGVEDVETVVKHHKKHCKAAQIVNPDASHF